MRRSPVAFALVLLSFSPAFAQQLVIKSAIPDHSAGTLFISGENFGSAPVVEINGLDSPILSASPQLLLVQVPESVVAQPGSYLLTVIRGKRAIERDVFNFTIGAVGPKGEQGPEGQRGERGDIGPAGAVGPAGPAGPSGAGALRLVDSTGKHVGTMAGASHAILKIEDSWLELIVEDRNNPHLRQCLSSQPGGCSISFYYEAGDCGGPKLYPSSGHLVEQSANIIDGTLYYPGLPIQEHQLRSTNTSDNAACQPIVQDGWAGELRTFDVNRLGLAPPFRIVQ
jgi:hypothetical protein